MEISILAGAFLLAFAAIAGGIGNAMVYSRYIDGAFRQPEMEGKMFTRSFIGIALVEALPIIAVAFGIMLLLGII